MENFSGDQTKIRYSLMKFTKVNSRIISFMDQESTNGQMADLILENGSRVKWMVKVCFVGKVETLINKFLAKMEENILACTGKT